MKPFRLLSLTLVLLLSCTSLASAEILALLNYESKPDQPVRREGIAIMDIDPESADFGKILMEIPLPVRPRRAPHLLQPRSEQSLYHGLGEKHSARRGPHEVSLPAPRDCRTGLPGRRGSRRLGR